MVGIMITNPDYLTPTKSVSPSGVAGDMVYALAASPAFARDGVCLAACKSGLYRSDDAGESWRFLFDSLALTQSIPVTAIALSPAFPDAPCVFAGIPGGLLRSDDGGATWVMIAFNEPAPIVASICLAPSFGDNGALWLGTTNSGVFHLTDRGQVWRRWNYGLFDWRVLDMGCTSHNDGTFILYAATESGLFMSHNAGWSWQETGFSVEYAPVLSIASSHNGSVFVGTESHGLYVSHNAGTTWQPIGPAQFSQINAVLPSATFALDRTLLILTTKGVFTSADAGKTWHSLLDVNDAGYSLTCFTAPLGLASGAPLLVGKDNGDVESLLFRTV